MQHKILLLDELGEKWGKTHVYYNLRTPAEAIKLLCINYPDFKQHLLDSAKNGICYRVTQVDEELDYSDLFLPLGQHDLVIAPVISGSKSVVKAVIGVGLVLATGGFGAGFATGSLLGSTTLGSIGANLGAALILSGVSDYLSPQPQLPSFDFDAPLGGFSGGAGSITRGSDGSQSYAYTGAANTVGLGKTIPVVYGKALVGGHILSTNIEVSNQSDPLMKYIRPPNFNTVLLNGERLETHYTNAGGVMARRYNDTTSNASGTQSYLTSNKVIDLQNESEQKIADITGDSSGNTDVKKFQILFQVGGLIDFVGEDGTTKIDGFITYRIKIKEIDDSTLVLNSQSTIQGLTTKNQNYSYITKLPYQKISNKSNYEVLVEIIDTGVDFNKASFTIKQVGYNLKKT